MLFYFVVILKINECMLMNLICDGYDCFCLYGLNSVSRSRIHRLWKYPLVTCGSRCLNYASRSWIHKLWKYPLVTYWTCWCEFCILEPNPQVVGISTSYLWNLMFAFSTFNMNSCFPSVMCDICVYEVLLVVIEHWCFNVLITWNYEIWYVNMMNKLCMVV